jgi:hypothetical protein
MTYTNNINSTSYWDTRFSEDWETFEGPNQSRFFAKISVEHTPRWFVERLRRESLSLVDWGCAQGDGTDVWASYISASQITGVDFSAVAIRQAAERYPSIRFVNEDWLKEGQQATSDQFDVLFSSNTLEHFHQPYEILNSICMRAKIAALVTLPYKELNRISEHFYSFLPENIPLRLNNGFRLIWSDVIDCRPIPGTLWAGDQIVLLYADPDWVDSLSLVLNDCQIHQSDERTAVIQRNKEVAEKENRIVEVQATLAARDAELSVIRNELTDRIREIGELRQLLQNANNRIAALDLETLEQRGQLASATQAVQETERKLDALRADFEERGALVSRLRSEVEQLGTSKTALNQTVNLLTSSRSWRLTRPLRLMNQVAGAITSRSGQYRLLKNIYWKLPEPLRQRLNQQRHAYIAKHLQYRGPLDSTLRQAGIEEESELPEWVKKANKTKRFVIIPCGFEFDELVNQRPINAAKYFAGQGYLVLFVAWQWTPDEVLSKGCREVWAGVHQVPLYDFCFNVERLEFHQELSIFLLTMPAPALVAQIPFLRTRGLAIVYDVMDEWEAFASVGQAPWYRKSIEESLLLQSDYVCVVSPSLKEKFAGLRTDIQVIGNGYTAEVIGKENKGIALVDTADQPVVGYFGHLTDAWFNWPLVFDLAKSRPEIKFEIIGYGEPAWVREKSASIPNLYLLGKVLPKDLSAYAARWSVGMIPFIDGVLAEAVDPIKIYEYLYFGLPTFVTGIRHLKDYPMTYFSDVENAATTLDEAIRSPRRPEELDAFLNETTWSARFAKLLDELSVNQNMRHLYVE